MTFGIYEGLPHATSVKGDLDRLAMPAAAASDETLELWKALHEEAHLTLVRYQELAREHPQLTPHVAIANLLNTVHMLRTTYPTQSQFKYFVQFILDYITDKPLYGCKLRYGAWQTGEQTHSEQNYKPSPDKPRYFDEDGPQEDGPQEGETAAPYRPFSYPEFLERAATGTIPAGAYSIDSDKAERVADGPTNPAPTAADLAAAEIDKLFDLLDAELTKVTAEQKGQTSAPPLPLAMLAFLSALTTPTPKQKG